MYGGCAEVYHQKKSEKKKIRNTRHVHANHKWKRMHNANSKRYTQFNHSVVDGVRSRTFTLLWIHRPLLHRLPQKSFHISKCFHEFHVFKIPISCLLTSTYRKATTRKLPKGQPLFTLNKLSASSAAEKRMLCERIHAYDIGESSPCRFDVPVCCEVIPSVLGHSNIMRHPVGWAHARYSNTCNVLEKSRITSSVGVQYGEWNIRRSQTLTMVAPTANFLFFITPFSRYS